MKGPPLTPTEFSILRSSLDRIVLDGLLLQAEVAEGCGDGVAAGLVVFTEDRSDAIVVLAQHEAGRGLSLQVRSFIDGAAVETLVGHNGLIAIAAPRKEPS